MIQLDDFLNNKAFKKYKNGIQRIEQDFKDSGYEIFLWKPFLEEYDCMKATTAKTQGYNHIPNKYISPFLEQFHSDDIVYIFPKRNEATFFIIQEVCKHATQFCVINNLFPEDDTINYAAFFSKDDIESIVLMNHLAYSGYMSDVFGGYKLFNNSLPYYADFCADDGQQYLLARPNPIMHFLNFQTRRDTNPFIIYDVRKKIETIIMQYYRTEFDFFVDLNYTIMPFFQNLYKNGIEVEIAHPSSEWKSTKEEIRHRLIVGGIINSKWKNEQSLYLLVQKVFPDALYQYRPKWLNPQSLDIYIPSFKLAIEYQGIQHYQPIDFFGGEEAFIRRVLLDQKKKQLCKDNCITLLTWDYNYDVTEGNLKKLLVSL